jgi:hypothetical protein
MSPPPGADPSQTLGYVSPGYIEPKVRPTSVTTVAIIGVIIGALGLLCIGGGTVWSIAMQNGAGNAQQRQMMAQQTPELRAFGYATGAVGFVLSLILLIGSIGALSLRPWARKMLVFYGVADIIYDTIKLFLVLQWMMPEMLHATERSTNLPPNMDAKQMASMMRWSMLITNWGVWVVLIAFAILVLAVMMRPNVKAAFEPLPLAPTAPGPL